MTLGMGKRGAMLAVVVMLVAGTSSPPQVAPARLIAAPGAVLAAEVDRPEPFHRTRLPITGELDDATRAKIATTHGC